MLAKLSFSPLPVSSLLISEDMSKLAVCHLGQFLTVYDLLGRRKLISVSLVEPMLDIKVLENAPSYSFAAHKLYKAHTKVLENVPKPIATSTTAKVWLY